MRPFWVKSLQVRHKVCQAIIYEETVEISSPAMLVIYFKDKVHPFIFLFSKQPRKGADDHLVPLRCFLAGWWGIWGRKKWSHCWSPHHKVGGWPSLPVSSGYPHRGSDCSHQQTSQDWGSSSPSGTAVDHREAELQFSEDFLIHQMKWWESDRFFVLTKTLIHFFRRYLANKGFYHVWYIWNVWWAFELIKILI